MNNVVGEVLLILITVIVCTLLFIYVVKIVHVSLTFINLVMYKILQKANYTILKALNNTKF